MKRAVLISIFVSLAIMSAAQFVDTTGLQDAPIFQNPTLDLMVEWYNLLYGALVVVLGIVFKALGVKKEVPNFFIVVLSTGIILAGAFVVSGFGEVLPLVFSFLSAVGFYEAIKRTGLLRATGLEKITAPKE